MFKPFVVKNLLAADAALSLGGGLNAILQSIGISENRIMESPNGIDDSWLVQELEPKKSKTTFIFIGRYERRKGIEELNNVIRKLSHRSDFEVHFIGPIPDRLKIQIPQVLYWGLVKEEQKVREILSRGHVLVCPSYSEGMPTVILEAMAMGLSVIGTDVGAVSALVSAENGWLIPPGNVDALQEAMKDAIETTESALLEKQKASLEKAPNYSWKAVAEQTIRNIETFMVDAA